MTDTLHTRAVALLRAPGDTFDVAARTIPVIASSDAIDDYGDVVDQATWKIDRFLKSPIALRQHCPWEDPLGYYKNVRVEGGVLRADLVLFAGAADPDGRAEAVLARYAQGGPVSVSVGFRPGRTAEEEREGRKVRVLYDCELHEISVVTIGANPDAVAQRAARRLLEHLRRKGLKMTFSDYLKERGMSPQECAAATGLPEDTVIALMGGQMPDEAQMGALADGLGLSMDEVTAMWPPKADPMEGDGGEEPAVVVIEAAAKGAKAPATDERELAELGRSVLATLGLKSATVARVRVSALFDAEKASRDLAARVEKMEAERRVEKRDALLARARAEGRLTPAREKANGTYLARLADPGDLAEYLSTLEPVVDATERHAPEVKATVAAPNDLAIKTGEAVGYTAEQLARAAANNDRRRQARLSL